MEADRETLMRMAAFEHVRRLSEVHDHLTASHDLCVFSQVASWNSDGLNVGPAAPSLAQCPILKAVTPGGSC